MGIVRQDDETEIIELNRKICEVFLIVGESINSSVTLMYMKIENEWHRFFIDVGVLFWDEGVEPDIEEDLDENEMYLNLGKILALKNTKIKRIKMENSKLLISFDDNRDLLFIEENEETFLRIGWSSYRSPIIDPR